MKAIAPNGVVRTETPMFEKANFDRELDRLDTHAEAGYFLALHIRFLSPLMVFQTFNQDWINHYTDNGYVLRDPLVAWAFTTTGTTRWSNPRIPDPFGIFRKADSFGLHYGITVSHGPMKSRTVGSVARSDREFEEDEIAEIREVVASLHDISEPPRHLTGAQADALRCIADGMRHAAAADHLGISESALKLRLAGARTRLMARTTAEAVQRAQDYRLL